MKTNATLIALCVLVVPSVSAAPAHDVSSSNPADTDWNAEVALAVTQSRLHVAAGGSPQVVAASTCTGDISGDGTVDGQDLLMLLSAWGPCDDPMNCPADLNGDQIVDGVDVLILLGAWGACPQTAADCQYDTGNANMAMGFAAEGVNAWAHRFTADCPHEGIITNIATTYGYESDSFGVGVNPGDPVGYAILADTGDGPGDVLWMNIAAAAEEAIGSNTFQKLPVDEFDVSDMNTFFVMVWVYVPHDDYGDWGYPVPTDSMAYDSDIHTGAVWFLGAPGVSGFDDFDPNNPPFRSSIGDSWEVTWMLRVNEP